MAVCNHCGARIDLSWAYCEECGAKLGTKIALPDVGKMICSQCGARIDPSWDFCEECGVKLQLSKAADRVSQGVVEGYVLTNVAALSAKLNTSKDVVRQLLEQYVALRQRADVFYTILDVSNYKPKLSINKHWYQSAIQLSPTDSWEDHQRLLMDQYTYDVEQQRMPKYLFIIGGDDIIPMPAVGKHSMKGDAILSDVPYSHLYGSKTTDMINLGLIFQQPQMLMVGRLPLSEDATLEMLRTYLQNVSDMMGYGMDMNGFYVQCDPHWKKVTAALTDDIRETGQMFDYDRLPAECSYHSILLTPPVTRDNVDSVYPRNATFYLFNMHGSDAPVQNDYYGVEVVPAGEHPSSYSGITPIQFRQLDNPNVVLAECCYGAKLTRRKHYESILFSALTTKTILFIGSTHVAWGMTDDSCQGSLVDISNADIIVREALLALCQGVSAGVALWCGKAGNFAHEGITPTVVDTALEFNLFGDPSLVLYGAPVKQLAKLSKTPQYEAMQANGKKLFAAVGGEVQMKTNMVYSRQDNSILSMIRQRVNQRINESHELISQYLYQNYRVKPRELEQVLQVSYSNGEEIYVYYYTDEDNTSYVVMMDADKRMKSILSSK